MRNLCLLLASVLLFAFAAEASVCILPRHMETTPKFARYLYGKTHAIALVRVISVAETPTSNLSEAQVEIVEVLKGTPVSPLKFHPTRLPSGPRPKVGESRIFALEDNLVLSCMNSFVDMFPEQELLEELRKLSREKSNDVR